MCGVFNVFIIALIPYVLVIFSRRIIKIYILQTILYFFSIICSPRIIYGPVQIQTCSNHLKKNGKRNFKENNLSVLALNRDSTQFSERFPESVSITSQDTATFISLSDLVCAHSICSLDPVSVSVLPSDTGSELLSPVDHV